MRAAARGTVWRGNHPTSSSRVGRETLEESWHCGRARDIRQHAGLPLRRGLLGRGSPPQAASRGQLGKGGGHPSAVLRPALGASVTADVICHEA